MRTVRIVYHIVALKVFDAMNSLSCVNQRRVFNNFLGYSDIGQNIGECVCSHEHADAIEYSVTVHNNMV